MFLILVEQYILGRKIATGGMAEVFLAHNREKKAVVIKKILPHLASQPEYVHMFQEELSILSSLEHENIVHVIETHPEYVVMEYLEGYDWRLISQYPVPLSIIIYLFLEALKALSYVHGCQIIHRDISPQNWMLTYQGQVKLLDFGISKSETRSHETVTGILKGKYSYMSPEQASGKKVSHQSDIFAMGVILFELCTQQRLFKRSNDIMTLRAIVECEVTIPDDIDPELGEIILKSVAKQKETRFQSCDEFRNALLNYGQKCNQIASRGEIAEFMRRLPRIKNYILFEVTQIKWKKNNLLGAGIVGLIFALLGLGWGEVL
ncbi:MAG: serine/threonine-protein kinase [Myxococcaceae bacterium]